MCLAAIVPSLGNRHLEVAQDLEQERLELGVRLVDLVDQQHDRIGRIDRLQQRPRQDEAIREEHVVLGGQAVDRFRQRRRAVGHLADLVLEDLGVEQLLGVLPLVERLGFVEALVALQADQPGAGARGDDLGELGLADAGRPLDEQRLAELRGQEDHGGDVVVADVFLLGEPTTDFVDGRVRFDRLQVEGSCGERTRARVVESDANTQACARQWS